MFTNTKDDLDILDPKAESLINYISSRKGKIKLSDWIIRVAAALVKIERQQHVHPLSSSFCLF